MSVTTARGPIAVGLSYKLAKILQLSTYLTTKRPRNGFARNFILSDENTPHHLFPFCSPIFSELNLKLVG